MDEELNFEVKVSIAEISKKLNIPVVIENKKDEDSEKESD